MKKILSYLVSIIFATVVLVYLSLAGYFWWEGNHLVQIVQNIDSIYKRDKTQHQITLLDHGLASFAKRIELIESAKKSIELEFFIYDLDLASRFLNLKLIEAAKRGVEIRILVDFSIAVFKFAPNYVKELSEYGIEVRYYNTAASSAIVSMQHRNHRKFLIIDGAKAFTGGRNIANDYFDLSDHYNFLDSDILIEGEIVENIQKSFYLYWDSKFATKPDELDENINKKFFQWTAEDKALLMLLKKYEKELNKFNRQTICNDIAFVTDFPGVSPSNRQVYRRIEKIVEEAKSDLKIESPYLVLKNDGFELLKNLEQRGVEVSINTNSLASTDAYYTVSSLWMNANKIKSAGIEVNLYNGSKPDYKFSKSTRYGIHSKRAVIDGRHTLIGTYNVDPRSANLNSEVLLICRDNEELANFVLDNLKERSLHSQDNLAELTKGASTNDKLKFYAATPLVYFFDFLL